MVILQGLHAIDQIAESIDDVAAASLSDVEKIIHETSTNIANIYTTVDDRLTSVSWNIHILIGYSNRIMKAKGLLSS